jgi:glucose/arabinose dehydrogenase
MRPYAVVLVLALSVALSGCTLWEGGGERPGVAGQLPGFESERPTDPPAAQGVVLAQTVPLTQAVAVPDGSGDLLLVAREGRLLLLSAGAGEPQEILDISDRVDAAPDRERGLKGAAFHPDFSSNGMLFVVYDTTIDPEEGEAGFGEVLRYRADPDDLAAGLEEVDVVLRIEFPGNWFHNMAGLGFGPDGMLYVGVGDGGRWRMNAQILENLWGTVLRLDVDGEEGYRIPSDNPFVGVEGKLDEIWLYGLRNPWRFAFHPGTGDLYIGNTGESDRESVYIYPADGSRPRNHGWPYFEGNMSFENPEDAPEDLNMPIVNYPTRGEDGMCAMIGGTVYHGDAFPALRGKFIFADHCSTDLMFTERVGDEWILARWLRLHDGWRGITSIDSDTDGELLAATLTGHVYRIMPP